MEKYILIYPMNTDGEEVMHGQVFNSLEELKRNADYLQFEDMKAYKAVEIEL